MSQQDQEQLQPQGLNPDYRPEAMAYEPGPNLLNEEGGSWPIAIRYINGLIERIHHLEHHVRALAMRHDPPESTQLADVRRNNTDLELIIQNGRAANNRLLNDLGIANAEIAKLRDICRQQEADRKRSDAEIERLNAEMSLTVSPRVEARTMAIDGDELVRQGRVTHERFVDSLKT